MIVLILLLSSIMGAMGRRIAGGVFETWTGLKWGQPTRLFFGLMLALSAIIAGAPFWISLILIPATWVGTTLGLFGGLGMGRAGVDKHPNFLSKVYLRDFGAMTLHGTLSIILPSIWAWYFGFNIWPIIISGLITGICYEIGYRIIGLNPRPYPFSKLNWPNGFNSSPEYGELIWGATRGLGVALAVILA